MSQLRWIQQVEPIIMVVFQSEGFQMTFAMDDDWIVFCLYINQLFTPSFLIIFRLLNSIVSSFSLQSGRTRALIIGISELISSYIAICFAGLNKDDKKYILHQMVGGRYF